MKKKVLFLVINMNVGGTEKALLNMMEKMPEDKFDITLLMLEKYGNFFEYIPEKVKVEYVKEYQELKTLVNDPPLASATKFFKNGNIIKGSNIAFFHLAAKLTNDRTIFFRYIFRSIPALENKYDIAIAYAGPMDFISYFVAERVKAEQKFQWIHFDVTKIGFDKHFAGKVYKNFDRLFVVSEEGSRKLASMVPSLEKKIKVFPNVISPELIRKQAEKGRGFEDDFDGIRILTVGRLSKEKGQDLIIPVLAKLKQAGLTVRWYCIGEGSARKEYEKLIKEYGVEKDFILTGATPNPYPFMKQCDIYVQPSRHEGYCITLAEAKCFNKPIICTDFTGAQEQLVDVPKSKVIKFDEVQMTEAIQKLIEKRKQEEKIWNHSYSGS